MFNLIWKDLLVQKRCWWSVAVLPLITLAAFSHNPAGALLVGPFAVAYVLIVGACIYDEKNKSDLLWCSLPISRKTIIGAKYLSALISVLLGIIVVGVYGLVIEFSAIPLQVKRISLEDLWGIFMITTLFISLYFPIYFKFGYTKSRYYGLLVYLLLFMLSQVLDKGLKGNVKLATLLINLKSGLPGTLAAFVLLLISYFVSLAIYQRKDIV